jgi:hypothetical protein
MIFITACSSPTDASYATIGEISNLKVTGDIGVNIITWDPVKDADSYDIYRREEYTKTVAGEEEDVVTPYQLIRAGDQWATALTTSAVSRQVAYLDIISDNNILVNDHRYFYKVVAQSLRNFTNVGNSEGEIDYTPEDQFPLDKFPAGQYPPKGTAIIPAITPTLVVDDVTGLATVSWDKIDNPAVKYVISSRTGPGTWTSISATSSYAILLPGTNQFIDVDVYAYLPEKWESTNTNYRYLAYYPAATAYIAPLVYSVRPTLGSFSFTTTAVGGASSPATARTVNIVYSGITGAASYVFQKAKVSSDGAIGTWTDITDPVFTTAANTYRITNVIDNDAYIFRGWAVSPRGVSNLHGGDLVTPSAVIASAADASPAVTASIVVGGATLKSGTLVPAAGFITAKYEFPITLTTEAGATYDVYYQTNGSPNSDSALGGSGLGGWTKIPELTTTATGPQVYLTWGENSVQRQIYNFRVVGTLTGRISGEGTDNTNTLYAAQTPSAITFALTSLDVTSNSFYLKLSSPVALLTGEYITVYGNKYANGPVSPFGDSFYDATGFASQGPGHYIRLGDLPLDGTYTTVNQTTYINASVNTLAGTVFQRILHSK